MVQVKILRTTIARLVEYLSNGYPPWASYRVMMYCRDIGLDKCPGVRPIGIGDIFRRLCCKIVLLLTKGQATKACGIDQLCCGFEAGIEGAVHHIRGLWENHADDEEPWGVLLIDARNAFNEGNRKQMVCTARHLWPSGARFLFNMYRRHAVLVMRGDNKGSTVFLHSKEGITQGCPLAMLGYILLLLPLIRVLKKEFSGVDSPWYADDGAAAGKIPRILAFFNRLCELGPDFGYFPEESKSKSIVRGKDLERVKIRLEKSESKLTLTDGSRYLGGFIGDMEKQTK